MSGLIGGNRRRKGRKAVALVAGLAFIAVCLVGVVHFFGWPSEHVLSKTLMPRATTSPHVPISEYQGLMEIKGWVRYVGFTSVNQSTATRTISFTLNEVSKHFTVVVVDYPDAVFLKWGSEIVCRYNNTSSSRIRCQTLQIMPEQHLTFEEGYLERAKPVE